MLLPATAAAASLERTFIPVADATVDASRPRTNLGSGRLFVDADPRMRSYLRFRVHGLVGTVTETTLRLFPTTSSRRGFALRRVPGNRWRERGITHANAPAPARAITGSSGPVKAGRWTNVDVTSLVQGDGTFSFALTTAGRARLGLASRESRASTRPVLIVETVVPPPPPAPPAPPPPAPPVNRAPTCADERVTGTEDQDLAARVSCADPDGDPLTYTVVAGVAHGVLSFSPDGTFRYTPERNYNGADSFTFKASDGKAESGVATASITVAAANDAPGCANVTLATEEDTPAERAPACNDVDGDSLGYAIVSQGTKGTASVAGGRLRYEPDPNVNGTDSFTYRANDSAATSDPASVAVTITPVNDLPVARDDTAASEEDGETLIAVLANDEPGPQNESGQALILQGITSRPAHGTADVVTTGADAGKIRYAPAANYTGPDSFTYRVCDNGSPSVCATASVTIKVGPINDAPQANADTMTTLEDVAGVIPVLVNDTDGDGDALAVTAWTNGAHGTVSCTAGGDCTYTPSANFNGADSFTYTASDGFGGNAVETVAVTVTPVNDPPTCTSVTLTTGEDTPADRAPACNDVDGDLLGYAIVSQGTKGTASVAGGRLRYEPNLNANGSDSFTYGASDGRATSSAATVSVSIAPVNDAPTCAAVTLTTNEDTPGETAPDCKDVDGDALTFEIGAQGEKGTASVTAGRLRYQPNTNANGSDGFSYHASDRTATSGAATVTVSITPVNDAPEGMAQSVTTREDTARTLTLTGSDVEGDALSFVLTTLPSNGKLRPADGAGGVILPSALPFALGTAQVIYEPDADAWGPDAFAFKTRDTLSESSAATVSLDVTPVNDPPVAADDGVRVAEDGAVVFDPTVNDSAGPANERGQALAVSSIAAAASYGAAAVEGGKIKYTPPPDYSGPDWLDYKVCDDGTTEGKPDPRCRVGSVRLKTARVVPTVETAPVPNVGDAADDAAIWVNPADPSLSTIVGTDKGGMSGVGGLGVYDLSGKELQYVETGRINNVDLRDGFPLGAGSVTLVSASNRTDGSVLIYRLDPATGTLVTPAVGTLDAGFEPYGLCMYRSAKSGKFYVFVTRRRLASTPPESIDVEQWELSAGASGAVAGTLVRTFTVGSQTEGCAADDDLGHLYLGEEDVGVWKYGAEPPAEPEPAPPRTLVDSTGAGGQLTMDVEGLTIAYGESGTGYLLASSQGDSSYTVYRREGANAYVGKFRVKAGDGVDGTNDGDGIDVTTASLGSAFPKGLFVAHDGTNTTVAGTDAQNYKLVPLELILGDGASVDIPARPTSCPRPYSDASPWNTPIASTPTYDPDSALHVTALEGTLSSSVRQFTYPVYEVTSATPRQTVTLSGWFSNVTDGGATLTNQRAGTVQLPIPEGAEAAAGSDAQIIIVDPATGDEWGAFRLARDADGNWKAENAYHYNTGWSGVPPRTSSGDPFFSRGAGVPYLTGLVRPCELARGRIEHALAFAYNFPTAQFVYPATKSDGNAWDGVNDALDSHPGDMPEGARLQLDPTLTVEQIQSWGCTGTCLTMARALQEYGMYIIDNSARPKLIVEYEGTAHWNGVVNEDTVAPIPFSAFRLLELPQ